MNYTLEVTQKKNGTFDHVVRASDGTVIATRNSKRRYASATIVRWNLQHELKHAREMLTWDPSHGEEFFAGTRKRIAELEARVSEGRELPAYARSFNSKPAPVPACYAYMYDFLGFATEAAS